MLGDRPSAKANSRSESMKYRDGFLGPRMQYQEFRDAVEAVLRERPDGASWAEIRELASLPQRVPFNGWVRRLERDIGLKRVSSQRGKLWRL